ncbi:MAG: transcription termination factor Rho [Spirochaetales bacterium]|jgi:transcription termination factor Rho|nr:transcription termination factor Rho [Exilispira sp.]NMC67956.1 transcription termination factor Rho [Spirochaetales bacterium]
MGDHLDQPEIQNEESNESLNSKNGKRILIKTKKKTVKKDDESNINNTVSDSLTNENEFAEPFNFNEKIGSFEKEETNVSNKEEQNQNQSSLDNTQIENEETEQYRFIEPVITLNKLLEKPVPDLIEYLKQMGQKQIRYSKKEEIVLQILKLQAKAKGSIKVEGVFEQVKEYGFLRFSYYSYIESDGDVYISPSIIRNYGLRTGDTLLGYIRPPNPNSTNTEKYFALERIEQINFCTPEVTKSRIAFENLIPIYPDRRIKLEYATEKISTRILDLFAPIGIGQRALIVAPPKAGKTMMLQEIANGIYRNHPDYHVIILLIDERPEEVTDMKENVPSAEVISSTFDEQPSRHIKVSEIVIEKAKRIVEMGKHVVILLDSITRLGRAYNLTVQASGKVLSGGVDASALHGPKKFFGAARNIRNGGSLTILATALVETGSKMDDVIFEEFKGTGNSEIILLRKLADRRVFPAIDLIRSSTRKEDLLLNEEERTRIWALRNAMADWDEIQATQKVIEKMRSTRDNNEFLAEIVKSSS